MPNNNQKNSFKKDWLPDIRKEWIPAIITGILGGVIIAFAVPWANSVFERQRLYQERKMKLLESAAEMFSGVISHTGKLRALEEAILEVKNNLDSSTNISADQESKLKEYISKRSKELRETEVALYSLYQKLEANFTLIRLFFGNETQKVLNEYFVWYEAQGENPIQVKDLSVHSRKLISTMAKEMTK